MEVKSTQQNPYNESPIHNGPVVGDTKIGELSEIVKRLLEEQRELKSKLNERDNIIADLSSNKDSNRKNTQERERRTRSLKPPVNNPKKVGSADNKSLAARRLREKHTKDKERIDAIESKIDKARRRKAEIAKEMSIKAQKVNGLARPDFKERPNSDFDPKLKRDRSNINRDLDEIDNGQYNDSNTRKPRAVESPGYSLSSKIDELNTQSRSKRSNYEYTNEQKAVPNQRQGTKYSNIKPDYDEFEPEYDNIQEEQAFMFSLPPDDDDDYSAYSMLGGQVYHRTPLTEFDALASEGGDQIDLLMNAYNRSNVRGVNANHIPMSDMTTSMGMNYSPNFNDMYVVNKDDMSSGFYQSGNFPPSSYPNKRMQNQQIDQFYTSGGQMNFGQFGGYPNEQFNPHLNEKTVQNRVRQLSTNAMVGQMMSNNGKLIMSPNRANNNIVYLPPQPNNLKYNR
mmetsp:Transcript_30159/g.34520  ORF Transcript_30159/g.34520 Transcript_30159/m.34520 type:complete len:453 (-) Transcript_30159:9-1367(-)